jgi:UDP-N-acetylmuramoylalanine--D-glutamate ligase
MCEASGRPTWVGGNLGTPLCESVAELTAEHVVVAEVSCFQLSTAAEFHPQVAVITNLAPDHLDYYGGSYDAYTAAKARVMAHLGAGEAAVLNADDALLCTWSAPAGAPTLWFSRERSLTKNEQGVFVDGLSIRARLGGLDTLLVPLAELSLPGAHNVENAMAAAAAALFFGISREAVCHAMRTFGGLTHRIERVRELNGITWYNDSKATNPHAAEAALRAFDEPLVLICGGSEKGSEFADWADLVIENCRHVICFGESSPRMVDALGGRVSVSRVSDLTAAVAEAQRAGADGGIVILSPACASFDQFDSYEHRGDVFKEMINAL